MIDFPTTPYNHESPNKYRLPIDTPLIPLLIPRSQGLVSNWTVPVEARQIASQ